MAKRLLHDLEIHKVELQLQNEELQAARSETEQALDRYRELFELAPIGYATLEDIDTIRAINRAGADLIGIAGADLLKTRFAVHVAESSLASFASLLESARARNTPVQAELELVNRGTPVPVLVHATTLARARPTIMLAFEDISERRAKEAELARTEHALREAARRKDEFLAVLSHELRNPLAPIRTSVSVLQMLDVQPARAREVVEIIGRSSDHLARLVEDLLDVTRITTGKIHLRRESVDIGALVRLAVEDRAGGLTHHGLNVDVRTPSQTVWVDGDPARLTQIVNNLLANVEKFTPAGGRVSVWVEAVDRSVLVRVRDTGIGISHDVIGQLGTPFAQAPQAIDRSRGGLGLGLAMVRSLAELHGGSFAIRSEGIGLGTEVIVALPEHVPPPAAIPQPPRAASPARRVLLIEDNPDAASSLARALGLRGHQVVIAVNGLDGIARAAELVPDVILCDLGLPDLDGFAVAVRLRQDERLRGCLLVALSGYASEHDVMRSLAAGFDRHLAKPARLADVYALLADA